MKEQIVLAGFCWWAFLSLATFQEPPNEVKAGQCVPELQIADKVFIEAMDAATGHPLVSAPVNARFFSVKSTECFRLLRCPRVLYRRSAGRIADRGGSDRVQARQTRAGALSLGS